MQDFQPSIQQTTNQVVMIDCKSQGQLVNCKTTLCSITLCIVQTLNLNFLIDKFIGSFHQAQQKQLSMTYKRKNTSVKNSSCHISTSVQ